MSATSSLLETQLARWNELNVSTPWLIVAAIITFFAVSLSAELIAGSALPWANYSPFELTYIPAKVRFLAGGAGLITRALEKYGGPFKLVTDSGPQIVFPASYVAEIDMHKELNFAAIGEKILFGGYPGFEVFKHPPDGMLEEVVRIRITRSLPKLTSILSTELDEVLKTTLSDKKEWHDVVLKDEILNTVAQLSSIVFVGPELGRNAEWNRLAVDYTVAVFTAVFFMRLVPSFLRPVLHWVIPQCVTVRREMARAKALLMPVIEEREAERRAAVAAGKPAPVYEDAIAWAETAAKGRPFDPVAFQMSLSLAAIHTTSDLLCQAVYNLCEHPALVEELREEATTVLSAGGWTKSSLLDLKLLDSFLKESQRLKPVTLATMQRLALAPVTLADGTHIPKGAITTISAHRHLDPTAYPSPKSFNPYRFVEMRSIPGQEHKAHLVSTSADHIGFSHGRLACPGRFFAANEIKIALVHLLLKYDFRYGEGPKPKVLMLGTAMVSDSTAKIAVKRRDVEIALPKA